MCTYTQNAQGVKVQQRAVLSRFLRREGHISAAHLHLGVYQERAQPAPVLIGLAAHTLHPIRRREH